MGHISIMALNLAAKKLNLNLDEEILPPCAREIAQGLPELYPISAEYYRILDRVVRGERPY
jgi:hypothetical protein